MKQADYSVECGTRSATRENRVKALSEKYYAKHYQHLRLMTFGKYITSRE
jgi:hypothetical protein